MIALTYIGGGLFCIGWLVLLIFSLCSQSEQNIQEKQHLRLPSSARSCNLSNNDTPSKVI